MKLSLVRAVPLVALLLAAVAGVSSCGGTTRNDEPASAGAGASPSGAAGHDGAGAPAGSSGAGMGGTVPPVSDSCMAMNARSDGTECGGVAGYTWNGKMCEPVLCGCAGADCDAIFPTMDDCDRVFDTCYAQAGITRRCVSHADCGLQWRSCCAGCSEPRADQLFAVHTDSTTLVEAGICLGPNQPCPRCALFTSPTIYPACVEGICSVVDVSAQATCKTSDDCHLVSKDCCACGGDFTSNGVMAVGSAYVKPSRCDDITCDECIPPDPIDTHSTCDSERGVCSLSHTLL